jgi:exonuclease SbcC
MLLEALEIEAVRGIRNRIRLPLDACVTVILAANGTAKTSLCDAAEWLFTGRVKRLQTGLIAPASIQNRYANQTAVSVVADVAWEGTSRRIVRTETESVEIQAGHENTGRRVTTPKFLERLTPQYVGQTSRSRNVDEQRAEWLRAVRFFSPDGLSLLLDDEAEAERIRSIAFAELLGVGTVGRRIEGLKGVRAQIDSPRARLAEVSREIESLEERMKVEGSAAAAPYFKRVDTLLYEVAKFCKVSLPEILVTRREILLSLKDRLSSAQRSLRSQRADHARIKESLAAYAQACGAWKQWLNEQKPAFEMALARERSRRSELDGRLRETTGILSVVNNRLGKLSVVLGESLTTLATIRLDTSLPQVPKILRLVDVEVERQNAVKNVDVAKAELHAWKTFADHFAEGQRVFVQLDILERHRLEMAQSVPSAEEHAAVEGRLRDAMLAATEIREQLNTSEDRWQRWGAEVKTQMANWLTASTCPLCGHDHTTPEQLNAAIAETLVTHPSVNADIAKRLSELDKRVDELRANAASMSERRKQLARLENEIAAQKETFSRFIASARGRGFDEQVFSRSNSQEAIGNRVRSAESAAQMAEKRLEEVSGHIANLKKWNRELVRAGENLFVSLPPDSYENRTARLVAGEDSSLELRIKDVDALVELAQKQTEKLRAQQEELQRTVDALRTDWEAANLALSQQEESWMRSAQFAEEQKRFIETIDVSWAGMSAEPLNDTTVATVSQIQQERYELLTQHGQLLAQAEQHLADAEKTARIEVARSEGGAAIVRLNKEQQALRRVDVLRNRLDSAIEDAERQLNQLLNAQIRPLLRVISSFYLRTQGNPFVDTIDVDPQSDENVLRWLGRLVDAKPLSASEMSQGQRQDLALSIFLARARCERGSFILDEPLAHLDDLNRVAFLDTLRAMIAETDSNDDPVRLIITTASRSIVRHLRAKFSRVSDIAGKPALRVIELVGDPRSGVERILLDRA